MTKKKPTRDDMARIVIYRLRIAMANGLRNRHVYVADDRLSAGQVKRALARLFPDLRVSVSDRRVRLGAPNKAILRQQLELGISEFENHGVALGDRVAHLV